MKDKITATKPIETATVSGPIKMVKLRSKDNVAKNADNLMKSVLSEEVNNQTVATPEATTVNQNPAPVEVTPKEEPASPVQNAEAEFPTVQAMEAKKDTLGITGYKDITGNLILTGAKKLRTAAIVPQSINAFRNVNGLDSDITIENSLNMEETPATDAMPMDDSSISSIEPTNDDVTPNFNDSLSFENPGNFQGTDDFVNNDSSEMVNDNPYGGESFNDGGYGENNFYSGEDINSLNIDEYRQEFEDLDTAKANLREMRNNVEDCKRQIAELAAVLEEQKRAKAAEREEVSAKLSESTAEYKDLRAQIIQMQELIARNNQEDMGDDSFTKLK